MDRKNAQSIDESQSKKIFVEIQNSFLDDPIILNIAEIYNAPLNLFLFT